jgi:protein involved in polysaccharide export with SLBB domain
MLLLSALCTPQLNLAALEGLPAHSWQKQLNWLDRSGLALYLFGTLRDFNKQSLLPPEVQQRWNQNLIDNAARMEQLAQEAHDIHRAFQRRGVRYATLKGFSLYPVSVSNLELRSQLDLDFLVEERDAKNAKELLEARGYTLRAVSGRSWKFKRNENAAMTLGDLYKPLPYRSVELHLEYLASPRPLLPRVQWHRFHQIDMPVLHPSDLFIGQGLHLFKNICSEFFRVSHVVEFRRHILARYNDDAFWREVRTAVADDPHATNGLGVAIGLATHVTGDFAPSSITSWTSAALPAGVRRWIEQFGARVTLGSFPGNKLYLLLQQELSAQSAPSRRTVRVSLIPNNLPPRIVHATKDETVHGMLRRYQRQVSFIFFRLRFHLQEGARYLYEAWRWKRSTTACFLAMALCLSLAHGARAQQQDNSSPLLFGPPSSNSQTADPSARTSAPSPSSGAGANVTTSSGAASSLTDPQSTSANLPQLSADQIIAVLQNNPDALIEVKQWISDAAAQQGQPISPENITDQMLYSRISSSADLRANLTVFLRARGYISDADIMAGSSITGTLTDPTAPSTSSTDGTSPLTGQTLSSTSPNQQQSLPANAPKEPKVLHRPTPYNLLSLHDLYSQVTDNNGPLKRFGADVFLRRDAATIRAMSASSTVDVPTGASYVLGPGDSVTIQIWGGVSQSVSRTVDREGFLTLPEAGQVQVAGFTLQHAQDAIAAALKRQFRNVEVSATLARLRSVRVYVVGDVQRPGAYEIGALATPIAALYAAGGPTAVGSLRTLKHYRGQQLLGEIDLYDFLLHGVQTEDRIQSGDTLLVPPAGPQVAVSGSVKRPAIYELKGATTLESILDDAGTATVTAELGHIVIDRIRANQQRETVNLDLSASSDATQARSAIATFMVQDGDRVRVAAIEPYSQRVIYTEGHVLRPGRKAYRDGMRLSDVIATYRDLLPEPADRGEIVRLVPPDLHVETLEFSVPDLMIGNNNLTLQPFDTIRILGRYEADAPKVAIDGEVLKPGSYSFSQGMTASQLVRMAGGFTRGALLNSADLTSYSIVGGSKVEGERTSVRIGEAVASRDSAADVALKAGDVLNIHKLTGWDDIGASIVIEGEVAHPGRYGFQQGEHLSSVLRRAGGFRDTSYPDGAVLIRPDVKVLEEKSKEELIRQIETSSAAASLTPSIAPGDSVAQAQLVKAQQEQILAHLKSQPSVGRLVIRISSDFSSWENTSADVEVRAGDVLRIPKRPGFVLVNGQVYNSSAITYTPGKTAGWYLTRAGGTTEIANRKEIFVIRANGSVVGHATGGLFSHDVLATRLEAGDVVVVPQKIIGASLFWRNLLTVAQIASSISITAAVAGIL